MRDPKEGWSPMAETSGVGATGQSASSDPGRGAAKTRHPGLTSLKRLWGGESFLPLFVLLLASLVFIIAGGDRRWAYTTGFVLLAGSLLLAVRSSRASRRWSALGWIALAMGLFAAIWQSLEGAGKLGGLPGAIFVVLIFVSVPLIFRQLMTHPEVTAQTIVGALCVYLLIGMDFAVLNQLLSAIHGGDIIKSSAAAADTLNPGDYYYHSFITMTTVGYGDFVPATGAAQTTAVLEGVLGQVFLVTIVARLVSVASFKRARASALKTPVEETSWTTPGPQPDADLGDK